MKILRSAISMAILFSLQTSLAQSGNSNNSQPATEYTRVVNEQVLKQLPFNDTQDFKDAKKGFIATLTPLTITDSSGQTIWDMTSYGFISGDAPDTVNPSLWRIAKLNMHSGLFKVVDRVYQIRGFDLSNMTIIEGDSGLILIDPLISTETARAGLELYYQHRPKKNVVAVIHTHSHVDHYGGIAGVVNQVDVAAGKVKIVAPEGFLNEAVSENVYAGNAMQRRSLYQYGPLLPRNANGQVDAGLGKTTSVGSVTLFSPTDTIFYTGEKRTIDGIDMVVQMAPNTEAPTEMLIWFPQFKLLNAAEDATHTLHNLYTLRGAQVRDAAKWWKTLHEAINIYGNEVQVVMAQHHWPTWGKERINLYLSNQRDMFKYLHDQSLNLINKGYTMKEVAEQITLPLSLSNEWYNRGYYGSVNHNAKAVYQRYIGWYDSNPANLHPLPPVESSKKYVDFMGGVDEVIRKSQGAFDKGEYRWVAEVMNQVVFAHPENKAARELQANVLEQLGYQSENPTWRNKYLMGAYELRNGVQKLASGGIASPDVVAAMSPDMLLDYMGILLNGPKAGETEIKLNWQQPGGEAYAIELRNGVIIYTKNKMFADAEATLITGHLGLAGLLSGTVTLDQEITAGKASVTGNKRKVTELLNLLDTFDPNFNIVTP